MGGRIIGFRCIGMALAAVTASSCGSGSPGGPTSPTAEGPHAIPRFIMIQDGHALPDEMTIAVGERVSFMNHDRTTYTIAGGRDPSGCPEINIVGVLTSGDSRDTEPFTTAKTCDFHVSRDQSALLTGRIIIR
jgi:plastocyanin